MLTKRHTTNINGECIINDVMVAGYSATLSTTNPMDIQFGFWINDTELYKAHRAEARADQAAFEDYAYSVQDEMLAQYAKTEPTE